MNKQSYDKVFGKNDIRGIFGETITPELFKAIGQAYSSYIEMDGNTEIWVSVAYDARKHSPLLSEALIEGLNLGGINVLNLGLCPTPLAYFTDYANMQNFGLPKTIGTFIITASHNPPQYNGLKLTYNKELVSEDKMGRLKEIVQKGDFPTAKKKGISKDYDMAPEYINFLTERFEHISADIKVVIDSGNGTAGLVAPELYRKFGCNVIDILSEPDGNFPVHHPNPSDEKNIQLLKQKVLETKADFGLAFDGDSDRLGVIDEMGNAIPGDMLLLIFALEILDKTAKNGKKPVFVSEVKCSQYLYDEIEKNGGEAIMWKTGHGFIKSKMKEENAVLAGEMSGHIFFKDRYFGYDDAFYSGLRFIEIITERKIIDSKFKTSDLLKILPGGSSSKEMRVPCPDEYKQSVIAEISKEMSLNPYLFGEKVQNVIKIDGLRIVFDGGFALIRASNTEPVFTLRFEAKTKEKAEKYASVMQELIDKNLATLSQLV